jgi:hypothetical protein
MKQHRTSFALPIVLGLSVIACTLGLPARPMSPVDAAGTIVAMTLQAQGASTSAGASSPVVTVSPSPSAAPATATTKPTLRINVSNAQCRSGPGSNFKVIGNFASGTTVDMVAKDSPDGYWLVKDPSTGNSCWVQAQDATPGGSYDLLPEVTPQATAGQNAPARPGSSKSFNYWEYDCATRTVTLRWIDSANNESGYHIYRNGQMIADLPAGSTTYSETISSGVSFVYSIRAYNDAGESAPLTTPSFSC